MGMDWDPEGDDQRKRESHKRWLVTLAVLGGIALVSYNFISQYMRERERERRLEEVMERQHMFNEMQGYAPTYR